MATENDRIDLLVQETVARLDEQTPPKYAAVVVVFGLSEESEGIKVHSGGAGLSRQLMGSVLVMVGDRWQQGEEG